MVVQLAKNKLDRPRVGIVIVELALVLTVGTIGSLFLPRFN